MLGFKMPLKCNQKAASSDGELLPSVPSVTPAQPQAAALEGSAATTEHQGLFILLPHHGKPGIQLLDSSPEHEHLFSWQLFVLYRGFHHH